MENVFCSNKFRKKRSDLLIFLILFNLSYSKRIHQRSLCVDLQQPSNEIEFKSQQIHLTCTKDEIIYIISEQYEVVSTDTISLCESDRSEVQCRQNVSEFSNVCNGVRHRCLLHLRSVFLHSCFVQANVVRIQYECIKDKNEMNMCKFSERKLSAINETIILTGYSSIKHKSCSCHLSLSERFDGDLLRVMQFRTDEPNLHEIDEMFNNEESYQIQSALKHLSITQNRKICQKVSHLTLHTSSNNRTISMCGRLYAQRPWINLQFNHFIQNSRMKDFHRTQIKLTCAPSILKKESDYFKSMHHIRSLRLKHNENMLQAEIIDLPLPITKNKSLTENRIIFSEENMSTEYLLIASLVCLLLIIVFLIYAIFQNNSWLCLNEKDGTNNKKEQNYKNNLMSNEEGFKLLNYTTTDHTESNPTSHYSYQQIPVTLSRCHEYERPSLGDYAITSNRLGLPFPLQNVEDAERYATFAIQNIFSLSNECPSRHYTINSVLRNRENVYEKSIHSKILYSKPRHFWKIVKRYRLNRLKKRQVTNLRNLFHLYKR
ncbi:hypothetical protein SNEBB_009186 [Seison nebaliae]|nr:hypothetical protein SNEBB_009186 [Seison nebaliae]